jgi:thioredoxin-dependent peroxiredoxin
MRLRSALPLLAALAVVTPASASLPIGAKAPDFTTRGAMGGKLFRLNLAEQLKKGPVVLYFFPKVFTAGCTVEANAFAEATPAFRKAGATVIGMSADTAEDLKRFSVEECRSKFAVASAGPRIITGYDVALSQRPGMTDRTSYVISTTGRIAFVHSDMSPVDHVRLTLAAVQQMTGK